MLHFAAFSVFACLLFWSFHWIKLCINNDQKIIQAANEMETCTGKSTLKSVIVSLFFSGWCLPCLPNLASQWNPRWEDSGHDVWWHCKQYRVSS
jgi:hypothetical protein